MPTIRIQTHDFDVSQEIALLRARSRAVGAIVSFIGVVRDINDGDAVSEMTLEHYPGMTERALAGIVDDASARWLVLDATVVHRVGTMLPTDQIVLVIVASAHRADAFAACEFMMDFLKTAAPFWKKEITSTGARWVDARASDDQALQKWKPI